VSAGQTVGIMMANHADYVVTWWAIARAGGLEVPVNVAYKGALLRYILDHADVELLVADASFLDVVAAVAPSLPRLRLVVVHGDGAQPPGLGVDTIRFDELFEGAGPPAVEPKPWDPAAIMYTSGTTGPSKGVVLPHNYFVNMGAVNAHQRDVRTTDVLYTCLPLFHGNAQLLTFMTGVVSGATVALGARFSVSGFWPDVRRYGATQFNYIGTILTLLLKGEAEAVEEGHRLRLGWGAGATAEVWQRFEDRFGIRVSEAYGMTENGMVLYSPPDAPRPGSCGKPIAMADVIVADDDDEPVAPGTVGQLLTRPRRPFTMMLGYHKMPEQTLSSFRNLWFHTGDAAYADGDGYVFFVDRVKDAIRRRGENISSFEVEQIVNSFPGVVESAAIPVPSELGEDEVLVCLVPRGALEDFSVAALVAFCREEMPRFMVPRYVRVLPSLPKTPTERVEKYKLRDEGIPVGTWDAEAEHVSGTER
jgi:crotonobetaine/carnitine-CoA ligase